MDHAQAEPARSGAQHAPSETVAALIARSRAWAREQAGVDRARIDASLAADPDARRALEGFEVLEDEVAASVRAIRAHPLMPSGVRVAGCTIDIETGALAAVDA